MPRFPRFRPLPAALLAGLVLFAAAPAAAVDWRTYTSPVVNFRLDGAGAGDFVSAATCSDGRGGFWVAYLDVPGLADNEVRLKRVSNDGVLYSGITITNDTAQQDHLTIWPATDGGCYLAWRDDRNSATTGTDIYVQSVSPSGVVEWTAGGVQATNAAGDQSFPVLGGGSTLVVVWSDDRNGSANTDIYAARLSSGGSVVSGAGGASVITHSSDQVDFSGAGTPAGVMFTWRDTRSGSSDIYAEYYSTSGFKEWFTTSGVVICAATGTQASPRIVPGDGGDAYVAWEDLRGADYDIYVQRVGNSDGVEFGSGGAPLCTAAGHQLDPELVSDGQGGAVVVWVDSRTDPTYLYAQRVAPSGAATWTANGVNVASGGIGTPANHHLLADGLGGVFVVWDEARAGTRDVFGQRLSSAGTIQWGSSAATIAAQVGDQEFASPTLGQDNSLLVAFDDARDGSGVVDLFAQRVDRFGYLGDASPQLADVSDVLGDQGGSVRLDWTPGYVEFDPFLQVASYYVLRQVPGALAARLERAGARLVREPAEPASGERVILAHANGTAVTYWEYVGQSPAFQADSYSYVAPTTSDSVPGVPASTQWMLQARNSSGSRYWFSNVVVGHSVDNLAPLTPSPFAGTYSGGATRLTWNPNREADLAGYRLYRGATAGFTPGPGNLVAALPDTGYVDAAGAPYVYKLTAVDLHQNESPVATLLPSNTVDVIGAAATALGFAAPWPNPASHEASLGFALSRDGRVRLAVFDAAGRELLALVDGDRPAGAHAIAWDLRDAGGRAVPPGLYFARLEAEGRAIVRRVAVVR